MLIHFSPQEQHFIGQINEIALISQYQSRNLRLDSVDDSTKQSVVYATDSHIQHLPLVVDRCYQIEPSRQTSGVISDEALFETLRLRWHEEAGDTSSITKIVTCPSYQRIIGMGRAAVPLILRQMQTEAEDPDHWSWALRSITGINPIPVEAAGDTVKIAEAWLAWGRSWYGW